MTARNRLIAAAVTVVVAGFAIGAWIALATRNSGPRTVQTQTARVAGVSTRSSPAPATIAPTPTAPPRTTPSASATPTPAATATPHPMATPHATVAPLPPTAQPATATAQAAALAQGAWEIDEANTQVGTIRWVGDAAVSGDTFTFDVRKASVAGRPAVPCERATHLRASLSLRVFPQTAPFREVNCQGQASNGEVRVTSFSSATGAFSGSFYEDGAKVGDFTAQHR